MNKVVLIGNLTRDPETRYSQSAEPLAICRFSVAVSKRFKREGEPDADFISCVAFGKTGEFVDKYFKKGKKIGIIGRINTHSYEDQTGQRKYVTDVIAEEVEFVERKDASDGGKPSSYESDDYYTEMAASQERNAPGKQPSYNAAAAHEGFSAIDESLDDEELPF
ncbi:MAG: single-stranded DNA-binding protein [Clostridiales bacterium]|jgi:single-strand DNA-binding protein|nr:single-stranded DNA-binding protein [Clostridiales bacterium]